MGLHKCRSKVWRTAKVRPDGLQLLEPATGGSPRLAKVIGRLGTKVKASVILALSHQASQPLNPRSRYTWRVFCYDSQTCDLCKV